MKTSSAVRGIVPLLLLLCRVASAACPVSNDSEALFAEGHRLQAAGELQDAIECQQRGLSLAAPGLRAAQERQILGKMLEQSGSFPQSVDTLKLVLPQFEQLTGSDSEATGDLLRQLGWVEYLAGTLPEAESHMRRALDIYTTRLGPRHLKVSKALNNLGTVLRDRGQYEDAESTFANALDVATKGLTPDDDMRAVIYNNVAGLWYYRGDYRRAAENYKTALPIFERLYGEVNVDVGMTVNNLGAIYEELGDSEAARQYYTRALAIQEKLLGPSHPTVGGPVNNLAVLAQSLGDLPRAEQLFQRALAIYEAALGTEHPTVAEVLVKYAALKHEQGQNDIARGYLERALRIQEAAFGPDTNWIATSLNELGPVYQALGRTEQANAAMVRSIGVAAAGGEQQVLLIAYSNYADVLAAHGEVAAAVFYGKFSVNLAQQMRAEVSAMGRAEQKSFLSRRAPHYRNLADRLIALGRLAEAEQVMTMLKEEEFFDFVRAAVRSADAGSTRADFSALERPYADDLGQALNRLATLAREFRTQAGDAMAKELRSGTLTQEHAALRTKLTSTARAFTRKATPRRSRAATVDTHQDVAPGVALVRYLVTDQRIRMIVATRSETIDTQVRIELPQLNRLVFALRQAVQDPQADPLPAAMALQRLLIAPLQPVLDRNRITSLELDLDGALRYVPFASLHDGKSFLIERYDVKQRTLTNPDRPARVASHVHRLAGFGVSKAVGGFPALPSVGAELDRIVRVGPQDPDGVVAGVLVMDEAFTEASLRETLVSDFSLVHVASHFVFRPGPLSDSYLLLGNGEPLTLERLREGRLSLANVDLLTLSACSTAMSESSAGGGELESFGVLAQRLGAHEVLATLWPVADRSTSLLMLSMYRAFDNSSLPAAQALRRAQLTLLHGQPRFSPYSHPFYWAPFILMSSSSR